MMEPQYQETEAQDETTDLEKYLRQSTLEDVPPPPPPKDSPPDGSSQVEDDYFGSMTPGLSRAESIFSFSKTSFSGQLSQLTSINLPDANTLSANITAIPTASGAAVALRRAAGQIQIWIRKARDVLGGMNAEDDIEWAAAGKEGLEEVDQAMTTFGGLVRVYVSAIEELQARPDVSSVNPEDLLSVVSQMEEVLKSWTKTTNSLNDLKTQVELAMEWEELWNVVLGDVSQELEELGRLIFEMEEKRHKFLSMEAEEANNSLGVDELETIVEDSPAPGSKAANRNSMLQLSQGSPPALPTASGSVEDSSILGLFARMQPLRASLDFLPMRLSMFQNRAESTFPSACAELEDRRLKLEQDYKKLETDAESLRKELGEDKWILVFRNAGRQAHKMCESLERSIAKCQDALDTGVHHTNPASLAKKVESYEARKMHYFPAVEKVLAIIRKGVDERVTLNGEILKLLADTKSRAESLTEKMRALDFFLEEVNSHKSNQLRDSISSIITMDRSIASSSAETPSSSPASSVIMGPAFNGSKPPSTPDSRRGSNVSRPGTTKRYSGIPQLAGIRPGGTPRATSQPLRGVSPSPAPYTTPRPSSRMQRPTATPVSNKPRWNSSVNTKSDFVIGHNHKPMSSPSVNGGTPTPSRRLPSRAGSALGSYSHLPLPSPLREGSVSNSTRSITTPAALRPPSRSRLSSISALSERPSSPSIRSFASASTSSITDPPPYSKLRKQASAMNMSSTARNNRISLPATSSRTSSRTPIPSFSSRVSNAGSSVAGDDFGDDGRSGSPTLVRASPAVRPVRPATAAGGSRRVSLLPTPKARVNGSGRESVAEKRDERPRWR